MVVKTDAGVAKTDAGVAIGYRVFRPAIPLRKEFLPCRVCKRTKRFKLNGARKIKQVSSNAQEHFKIGQGIESMYT